MLIRLWPEFDCPDVTQQKEAVIHSKSYVQRVWYYIKIQSLTFGFFFFFSFKIVRVCVCVRACVRACVRVCVIKKYILYGRNAPGQQLCISYKDQQTWLLPEYWQ